MKKTYISPRAIMVNLSEEMPIIANSFKVDNSDDNAITGNGDDDAWTRGQNPIWDSWQ